MPQSNGAYRNSNTTGLQVKMTIILIILKSSNILLCVLICARQDAHRVPSIFTHEHRYGSCTEHFVVECALEMYHGVKHRSCKAGHIEAEEIS
jgi:hypothetical protein